MKKKKKKKLDELTTMKSRVERTFLRPRIITRRLYLAITRDIDEAIKAIARAEIRYRREESRRVNGRVNILVTLCKESVGNVIRAGSGRKCL